MTAAEEPFENPIIGFVGAKKDYQRKTETYFQKIFSIRRNKAALLVSLPIKGRQSLLSFIMLSMITLRYLIMPPLFTF